MLSLYLSICFSEDGRIKVAYVYDNYRPFMIRVAYKYVHNMDFMHVMRKDTLKSRLQRRFQFRCVGISALKKAKGCQVR